MINFLSDLMLYFRAKFILNNQSIPRCPYCSKKMRWDNDSEMDDEHWFTQYQCKPCKTETWVHWGKNAEL